MVLGPVLAIDRGYTLQQRNFVAVKVWSTLPEVCEEAKMVWITIYLHRNRAGTHVWGQLCLALVPGLLCHNFER